MHADYNLIKARLYLQYKIENESCKFFIRFTVKATPVTLEVQVLNEWYILFHLQGLFVVKLIIEKYRQHGKISTRYMSDDNYVRKSYYISINSSKKRRNNHVLSLLNTTQLGFVLLQYLCSSNKILILLLHIWISSVIFHNDGA